MLAKPLVWQPCQVSAEDDRFDECPVRGCIRLNDRRRLHAGARVDEACFPETMLRRDRIRVFPWIRPVAEVRGEFRRGHDDPALLARLSQVRTAAALRHE